MISFSGSSLSSALLLFSVTRVAGISRLRILRRRSSRRPLASCRQAWQRTQESPLPQLRAISPHSSSGHAGPTGLPFASDPLRRACPPGPRNHECGEVIHYGRPPSFAKCFVLRSTSRPESSRRHPSTRCKLPQVWRRDPGRCRRMYPVHPLGRTRSMVSP